MAQAESTECNYLQFASDHDDNPPVRDNAVAVNLALFGKAQTGRSSFVNAMLGYCMIFVLLSFDIYII